MEITVKNRYIKISPRKVRPVLHGLRGKSLKAAKISLQFMNRKAAGLICDLVKSGIAAAKENYLEPDKTTIKSIFCNEAPRLKRIQPWSKGQARRITKRMSHIVMTLESLEETKATPAKTSENDNKIKKDKR